MSRLVEELTAVVGTDHVLNSPAFTTDWTGRFVGHTPAVVQPGSVDEVAAAVHACRSHGAAIVPQGGNTGLVGGGVPLGGEVVVSLVRLNAVAVDATGGQVVAGAGATLSAVHEAAGAAGWAYGVDFASRDRATVGGTIATNAGGLHVFRHGNTRAQVIGVEAVLGDGSTVSQLGGLTRDNAGYHLPSLLCGSEGTLGIVTAARLRLVPRADERVTALLAFGSVGAAVTAAYALRRYLRTAEAIELVLAGGLDLVCQAMGLAPPLPARHQAYLLVEAADSVSPAAEVNAALASLAGVEAALVTAGPAERHALWQYREKHTESVNTLGVPHKLDVALPGERLTEFIEAVPSVVAGVAPAGRTWLWGHAAEGNVHVNVTGVEVDDDRADDAVLRLVVELGGSISAEHGIGTAKKAWLSLTRTPAEIAAYRAIKRALDPDGILNPNVLLPQPS
ncbi:MAG: FAD-binding oxidoreductase [Acidimicrobiales bacterium]